MTKVSIIIPVYNAEKYLGKCLESLLSQTLQEMEIICVDDGSSDGSPEILKRFQERDGRVRILTQENQYAGAARNNGMKEAQGEYLLFLDADDFFENTLLEKVYNQGKKMEADIVLFGAKQYNDKTGIVSPASWYFKRDALPRENPFSGKTENTDVFAIVTPAPWTKLFRREFVEKQGLSFQGLQNSNDVYFVLTALALAEKITYVDEELVFYRVGMKGSLQGSKSLHPDCFIEAYAGVYHELQRRGIYERYEEGFMNILLSGCAHNLRTVTDWELRRRICERMAEPEFAEMGLMERREEYFRRKEDFVFVNGILNAFEWEVQHQKRLLPTEPVIIRKAENDIGIPRVSVIIPVYNVEKYLRECLDSIVNQTLREIEIICVDDGSTDGSPEILREYGEKDCRITIISQENRGISSARNHGADIASGEYFYFMDGDDILERDALSRLYQLSEEKSLDVLYFDGKSFFETEELKEIKKNYITYYARKGDYSRVMTGPQMLHEMIAMDEYRSSLCLQFISSVHYRQENLRFEEGIIGEDNIFTFQCIMPAHRVYHMKEAFFHRRVRGNSVMTSAGKFEQVYGFFAGYLAIERAFRDNQLNQEDAEGLSMLVRMRLRLTRKLYHDLEPEYKLCFEALKPEEKTYFLMLVKDYDDNLIKEQELREKYRQVCKDKTERGEEIHTLRREKQERGEEIRTLRREKQERGEEIRRQEQEIKNLEKDGEQLRKQLRKQREALQKDKEELQKSIASIKASFSYRLGRALTKPFRWIKSRLKA
ncbi:MAG: glycosyltransferase [Clostridiales bacterium]|nr:glycosyltransferase [Clostridiales bacterium]